MIGFVDVLEVHSKIARYFDNKINRIKLMVQTQLDLNVINVLSEKYTILSIQT